MPEILTFEQALDATADLNKRRVLLGNGFSRACRDDIFAYNALFERAQDMTPLSRAAFNALGTTDFEVVMRAMQRAAVLVDVFAKDRPDLAQAFRQEAEALREVLAVTIAGTHPDRPRDIPADKYTACRTFLHHFDDIYTLNYDLLLYWAVMQEELEPAVNHDDGFRQPDDGPEEYVTWEVEKTNHQNIHYLHGALHIFDAGAEVQKFTWSNTQVALVDQIRDALATNRFPLYVAEGSAEDKRDRIQHSSFLGRSYRSFSQIEKGLFIFGCSMAENDEHILRLIDKGKMSRIAVGLYGDPESETNQTIIRRAEAIPNRRSPRRPAEIIFFDAASAAVWG